MFIYEASHGPGMTRLTLLGTGGGRFATVTQERATGGLYLEDGTSIHIDPGPGSLVMMRKARLDPMRTDGILVSHCHPDHYTDAEVLLEAMTNGTHTRRGVLAGSRSVLEGDGTIGPAISAYHRSAVEEVRVLSPGDEFALGRVTVRATPASHSDGSTIGFRLATTNGEVGYVPDTALDDGVIEANKGVRVLVVPVTRPLRSRIEHHLCTEDAAELVSATDPELAVLNHLGLKILREDPQMQADWIAKKSGVRTVVGEDLMRIRLDERLTVRSPSDRRGGGRRNGRGRRRGGRRRGDRRSGDQGSRGKDAVSGEDRGDEERGHDDKGGPRDITTQIQSPRL
jgi:phosphoribosyl 1,2-cyclic phosphodiesterase